MILSCRLLTPLDANEIGDLSELLLDPAFQEVALVDDEVAKIKQNLLSFLRDSNWLILSSGHDIIGYLRFAYFSSISASVHGYVKPKYWGLGISDEFNKKVDEWFKLNTTVFKLIVFTPRCCEQVIKAVVRMGYEIEGVMMLAVVWRQKVENLVILSKFIHREI